MKILRLFTSYSLTANQNAILLFFLPCLLYGQFDSISLQSVAYNKKYGLSKAIYVLEDQNFTAKALLQSPELYQWERLADKKWEGRFKRGKKNYWFYLKVFKDENIHGEQFAFHLLPTDTSWFYLQKNNTLLQHAFKGIRVSSEDYITEKPHLGKSTFRLDLEESGSYDVLLKVSSKPAMQLHFEPTLYPIDEMLEFLTLRYNFYFLFQGFFKGICLLMSFFAFVHYLIKKDRTYLYYALYTLSVSIFYLRELSFNDYVQIVPSWFMHYYFYPSISLVICALYVLFAKALLGNIIIPPIVDKIFNVILFCSLLALPLLLLFGTFDIWVSWKVFSLLRIGLFLVNCWMLIILLRVKNKIVQTFVFGSFVLFLMNTIGFILDFTSLQLSYPFRLSDEIIFFGVLIESIIFYYLLAYNSKIIEMEKMELEANNIKLKEINVYKDKFFANLTHDFRTPITIIKGTAEDIIGPAYAKETIRNNSNHLLSFVEKTLEMARIKAEKEIVTKYQIDIIPMMNNLIDIFQSTVEHKRISLSFHSFEESIVMDIDDQKFKRILSNIISNAIRFTPKYGQVKITAKVDLTPTSETLKIMVVDTGIGIPEDKLPMIFERFFTYDDVSKGTANSGIGLSIAKEYVELLDGDIWVKSEVDKGTTFTLSFPIERSAPVKSEEIIEPFILNETHELQNEIEDSVNILNKTTILIIDDSFEFRRYLKRILSPEYQVIESGIPSEGITKAIEELPDIIICDVLMPEISGPEVCEAIRNEEKTEHIPILLLSAKDSKEDRVKGLKSGANFYLSKPFEKKELKLIIDNILELKKQTINENIRSLKGTNQTDTFLKKLNVILDEELDNSDFNTNLLCRKMNISRSQLHKKIKALTGLSTSNYVRVYRLNRAQQLLKSTDLNVSEIAYEVGFSSISWFSQAYTKEFGESPLKTKQK